MKISVTLSCNVLEPLTYESGGAGLQPGTRVLVPLGRRIVSGWVLGLDSPYAGKVKNIIGIIDDSFRPRAEFLDFARRCARAYFASPGIVLDHALPPSRKNLKKLLLETDGPPSKLGDFSPEQLARLSAAGSLHFFFRQGKTATAAEAGVDAAAAAPATALPPYRLLLGADGRDHEYQDSARAVLASGRSVLLLVPDNATARYWQSFWPELDVYNSDTRPAAREEIWARYQRGQSGVVCGGLSAALLPMNNLGLLIIDRAASPLYRRALRTPFHCDQLGRMRAEAEGVPVLEGAASHSCSSYRLRTQLRITDRRPVPGTEPRVHMLKGKDRAIPAELVQLISGNYAQGVKTLVLVNKIQPALNLFCPACAKVVACPRCGGVLQVTDAMAASCSGCSFGQEKLTACTRCRGELTLLHDISLDSLARAVGRVVGENAVQTLRASDMKGTPPSAPAPLSGPIVIATAAALNPFFRGKFAAAIYVKPESFFGMDEFNSAEMIFATAAEIAETLAPGGCLHVFSVFHFHYALQFLLDESRFFERELKYRQWFALPPFCDVYKLEIRRASLRGLAADMRRLIAGHQPVLGIRKAYLASRRPQRGSYLGVLELHASAQAIIDAGVPGLKRSTLKRLAV